MISPCPQCPRLTGVNCRPVPMTGPSPCPYLFIEAGPGKTEAQTLIPYSGLAGDELTWTYLQVAHLHRDRIAISNASLCYDGSDKVSDKRIAGCAAHHLPITLDRVKPEVVVLMGRAVQQLSDTRVRLDMQHGYPTWGTLLDGKWEGWIVPMYEPALGMRETSRMTQLLDDFRHLGQWLRGEWVPPTHKDQARATDYQLVGDTDLDLSNFEHYLHTVGSMAPKRDDWRWSPPVDTERHGSVPWSVQLSAAAHTGRMVRAENKRALEVLARWIVGRTMILHHAGQDQDVLDKLGIPTDGPFRDTMQEAFQLCSLPQGLKPLAYRELGVTMRSWSDVVWPASVNALLDWIGRASVEAQSSFQDCVVHTYKRARCRECGHQHTTGRCKSAVPVVVPTDDAAPIGELRPCGCTSTDFYTERVERKAGAMESILAHITRYTLSTADADEPYDPWDAAKRMRVEGLRGKVAEPWQFEYLEQEIGPMPILGIGNVPLPEAIRYGCADADMTGQVATVLAEKRGDERWRIDDEDRDK